MWPARSIGYWKMAPRWHAVESNSNNERRAMGTGNVDKSGSHVRRLWSRDTVPPSLVQSSAEGQVETAVVHSGVSPSETRTLLCTALSRDIQVKLEEIEVLDSSSSSSEHEDTSRRRQHQLLAGGTVVMERDEELTLEDVEKIEFAELEEHVWLLLWLVLGPQRLQHLSKMAREEDGVQLPWDREGSRLVWRALQLCCSARGSKTPSAVPLSDEHGCDLACLRDHASRMLEVCAPTRELWRSFGWAGLTVDSVLHKVLREDVLPHVALLPAIPAEVTSCLRRIDVCQALLKQAGASRSTSQAESDRSMAPTENSPPGATRRKRGRPAKSPTTSRREPGRLERVFLWRFLLELLEDSRLNGCLRWVQRDEGIFRILNTDMLARLWGRRHGNPRMTYEKMARAMRTYYRSRVLVPVPRARNLPRKLVYRFSPSVLQRIQQQSGDTNSSIRASRPVPAAALPPPVTS